MRRPSFPTLLGLVAVSAWLAAAPAAWAGSPLDEYQHSGHITPCKYSANQLQGDVPNDVAQYAPEFLSQLQSAARDRARGCGGGSGGGGSQSGGGGSAGGGGSSGGGSGGGTGLGSTPTPPKVDTPPATGPPLSIPRLSPTASGVGTTPGPILALAIVAAVGVLGLALVMIGRLLGWGLDWTAPVRHALREGGMRAGAAVSGVADWARGTRGA